MRLNQLTRVEGSVGETFTYGTQGMVGNRFGGAHKNGIVGLHEYVRGQLVYKKVKCSTYRKAQRKLLQWLKGYNV
jgi:hypothetical protein